MEWGSVSSAFAQALRKTLSIKKSLFLFLILVLASATFLFFQLLSLYVPTWLKWPLLGVPLFISLSLVMGAGAVLVKLYHQVEESRNKDLFLNSGEIFFNAAYPPLVLFLVFIVLWLGNFIFLLLKALPFFGSFFGVVLSFGPYLFNVFSLFLLISLIGYAFYVLPRLENRGSRPIKEALDALCKNPFISLLLLFIALVPIFVVWKIAGKAAFFTIDFFGFKESPLLSTLQAFFIALPFMAVITLPLHFFFNFSKEAYQLLEEEIQSDEKFP